MMRNFKSSTFRAILLGLAVSMLSLPAHAADPTEAMTDQARALYAQGIDSFKKGEYDKAYAASMGAWALKKHYAIAGSLAASELKLGKHRDAAEHLRYYLEHRPDDVGPEDLAKTQALYNQATAEVVRLTVNATPAGVVVTVNGMVVTPGELGFYDPGVLKVEGRADGYAPAKEMRTLAKGASDSVTLNLQQLVKQVVVKTVPKPMPKMTVQRTVQPGEMSSSESGGPDGRLVAGIVTGGLAAVGLAVGIGGSVSVSGHAKTVEEKQMGVSSSCAVMTSTRCDELADAIQAHNTSVDIATGGFVAGGILAAASAGLLVWWATDEGDEPSTETTFGFVPSVSQDGFGLTMTGAW